jgi:hypothetical protein
MPQQFVANGVGAATDLDAIAANQGKQNGFWGDRSHVGGKID